MKKLLTAQRQERCRHRWQKCHEARL